MISRRRSVLGLAAAGALLAGCGGSSSSGLTRTQLVSKVNAACNAYRTAATSVPQPPDFFSNAAHAAAYLDKLAPLVHTEYNTIAALKPPGDAKADFDMLVTDGKHQLSLFDSARTKAHAKDASGIKDLQDAATYKQTVLNPIQRRLGFKACLS